MSQVDESVAEFDCPFSLGQRIVHTKSGGHYIFRGLGIHEATLEPMCAYESVDTGVLWFRVATLMFDGRFVAAEPAP